MSLHCEKNQRKMRAFKIVFPNKNSKMYTPLNQDFPISSHVVWIRIFVSEKYEDLLFFSIKSEEVDTLFVSFSLYFSYMHAHTHRHHTTN